MELYILSGLLKNHKLLQCFKAPIRLCVGKEWHRFPSSFFLPENVNGRLVELQFVRSDFAGILPKHFPSGHNLSEMTRKIPAQMNDENREETARYVLVESCNYLIDVDTGRETEREPNYSKMVRT